ncbi:alpha/beta hydrolase family protein [Acetobacter conturbans]|uniref:Dienelactone hydrolase n=1 Tax=Acetobacter conturbans TaxID=1737472 RepID=A0ABX0K1K0_9PROT|nr:CocE/NonD family hydrolase [Acetobacter conturbans]NHN88573.1 dienelactone hydrolase [Acetobacter conturbans]
MRPDATFCLAAMIASISFLPPSLHAASIAPISSKQTTLVGHTIPFEEQIFRIPVQDGTILEATLLLPHLAGPFPLAIISGGASHISLTNHGDRKSYSYLSGYFLSRGYAVLLPMPRGFADSDGTLISHGCALTATAQENAEDIRAVSASVIGLPEIDATRIVTAGVSFGGWVQMAMSATPLAGTKAQVLFFPLMHDTSCHSDNDRLVQGARELGAASSLPTLWVQGENDSLAPTELWKTMFAAYKSGNPKSTLVDVPPFQTDSHALLNDPDGMKPWMAQADALLTQVGLPSRPVMPEYMPLIAPDASGYAALDDFSKLPQQNDMIRKAYRMFLSQKLPRAFIIGSDAQVIGANGIDPIRQALAACSKVTTNCRLYAYNDRVVWQPNSNPASQSEHQTITIPAGKVATVFYTAITPECTQRYMPAIHLVTPPTHGAVAMIASATGYAKHTMGPLMKCNTISVKGSAMQYRADPNFHGTDSVVLTKQVSADPKDPPQTLSYSFVIQ